MPEPNSNLHKYLGRLSELSGLSQERLEELASKRGVPTSEETRQLARGLKNLEEKELNDLAGFGSDNE
jgi:predicted HTH domain antitoxin